MTAAQRAAMALIEVRHAKAKASHARRVRAARKARRIGPVFEGAAVTTGRGGDVSKRTLNALESKGKIVVLRASGNRAIVGLDVAAKPARPRVGRSRGTPGARPKPGQWSATVNRGGGSTVRYFASKVAAERHLMSLGDGPDWACVAQVESVWG